MYFGISMGVVLLVTDPARAEVVLSNLRQVEPERPLLVVIEDIDRCWARSVKSGS